MQSADFITLNNRRISIVAMAENVCWFKFDALCSSFRSKEEYLDLSELFKVFIIERIPMLTKDNLSAATRFTWFVDIIYDRKINLILTADVDLDLLFSKTIKAMDFDRTKSRLHEITALRV